MTKNLQIALIVLVVLIGIFFLNKSSQSKLDSTSEAIFNDDHEDVFKFLIHMNKKNHSCHGIKKYFQLWFLSACG